jgi:hypothetical protein
MMVVLPKTMNVAKKETLTFAVIPAVNRLKTACENMHLFDPPNLN